MMTIHSFPNSCSFFRRFFVQAGISPNLREYSSSGTINTGLFHDGTAGKGVK
jgi:hypothetical protein